MRPPAGPQVALETRRQVDRGYTFAGTDRVGCCAQVVAASHDRDPRRGRQRLHEQPRRLGMVHIDDGDAEAADDRAAEGQAEQSEGDHRNTEQQEARNGVPADPAHLAPDNGEQTGRQVAHKCRSDQSV